MDAEKILLFLQENKQEHTVKSCSSSVTIKIEGKKPYFFPSGEKVDAIFLPFISSVKNEVIKSAENYPRKLKEISPKFIRFSPFFSETMYFDLNEWHEIDMVGAYWFAAFDLGFISEKTYLEGLEVPKKVRLMALGAAASTKDIMFFDGEKYEHKGMDYSKYGRIAFFTVAKHIDTIMNEALEIFYGSAAFYWVDAIFVKAAFADSVAQMIEGRGFEVKNEPLEWLKIDAEKQTITAKKKGKIEKTYYKPRKKINKKL